jgi:hypothetical protein
MLHTGVARLLWRTINALAVTLTNAMIFQGVMWGMIYARMSVGERAPVF